MYANHSDLSIKFAALLKAELINEGQYPMDLVETIVNHYDLETNGLGEIVADLARIIKTVTGE
jgi:hypothetical protein